MRIMYKLLDKTIPAQIDNLGNAIIDADILEYVIEVANKAYEQGYAKAKREEYEKQRQQRIEGLKHGI